jgi:Icc-related predicted phosphoesterase
MPPRHTGVLAVAGTRRGSKVRIGIISDIHGNAYAFQAVLDDLMQHPCDRLICLGDAVQGGAQPAECVRLLDVERLIAIILTSGRPYAEEMAAEYRTT